MKDVLIITRGSDKSYNNTEALNLFSSCPNLQVN